MSVAEPSVGLEPRLVSERARLRLGGAPEHVGGLRGVVGLKKCDVSGAGFRDGGEGDE